MPAVQAEAASIGTTIARAAAQLSAAGIDDARLEAEVLFAHATGSRRSHVLATMRDDAPAAALDAFGRLLTRRLAREPLAYITGHREFYGIDIACAPGALIPRPESEMLVDIAVREIERRGTSLRIADIGTGSGAIAIAIAKHAPGARVTAIDASSDALDLARKNAQSRGVLARIELREGDLLEGAGEFDVIVANLPYVSEAEWPDLQPEIRDHEPRHALVGGPDGTEVIERLLRQADGHLASCGLLACEIGATQGDAVRGMVQQAFPQGSVDVVRDLAGLDRVVTVRKP